MSEKFENEKLIHKFLHGELPEQERFEFEEKFVADPDLFDEVRAVEDELIEKYVRGWMDSAERLKFEQAFLTTEKRRERVGFSRQLIEQARENQEVSAAKKNDGMTSEESVFQKLGALFVSPKFALAATLLVLIAAIGGWSLLRGLGGEDPGIVKNQNSNISRTPGLTPTPTPEVSPDETPEDSGNTNKRNAENTPTPTPTPPPSNKNVQKTPSRKVTPPPKAAPNPVLALFPGTLRSGGQNNVLKMPKTAAGATLQLNLESVDYKNYQAQLTDADGNVLFQKGNLKAPGSRINFYVPGKSLKRGDYLIRLSGKNDAGQNESVADFQFRVQQ
ncbi:MAG: hypothetical protein HKN33_05780 [Pyrinomonadaceae bacterium]|nr:hypothetical protein [Pyrinomonadaceae bacterium]